jgi:predicted CXXCH cytochrome family protein
VSDDVSSAIAYRGPTVANCAVCHKDQDGAALIASIDEPTDGELALRVDFPHALHMTSTADVLRDGCFSCHTFEEGVGAPRAVTKPQAAICLPCHQTHANVGGDGCALCHPRTSSGASDLAFLAPDTREKRAFVQRVPTPGFSHASRGHEGACTTCHAGTDTAATIHDVRMPAESDAVCWKCHVEDGQRFHWRGAPVAAR